MVQRNRVRGLRKADFALKRLPERVAARVTGNALAAAARIIRDEAKARVQRKSGALRDAIVVRRVRGEKGRVVVGFLKPTSRRAHLTEFGTSRSSPFPFMRPAFDATVGKVIRTFGRFLGAGIAREAGKLHKPTRRRR